MTEVHDTAVVGRRRGDADEPRRVDEELAGRLVEEAREQGVELRGGGGLLRQMTEAVLERALAEELTDRLGYEPNDPAGRGSGNSRNGYPPKTVRSEAGSIDLEVPRDRSGSFEPRVVRKGQRRVSTGSTRS